MSRILTIQRMARELGRLRTGYSDGGRPKRLDTWLISSHSRDYVEAAADIWGGSPETWTPQGGGGDQYRVITHTASIDAILPPGDPLSQSYEMWSRAGCARRCDGITEQLSDSPCLCRSQFGDSFYEQRTGTVCSMTTRLNVIIPAMPDMGVWRAETHSFYAANELAGTVDTVRGLIGPTAMVPVRLRIEQRSKAGGKKFPVVVCELRGITAGQVLEGAGALPSVGSPPAVAAASPRHELTAAGAPAPAAPSAPVPDYVSAARAAFSLEAVREVWAKAKDNGHLTDELGLQLSLIAEQWKKNEAPAATATPSDRDPDDIWADIVRKTPDGWTMDDLEQHFASRNEGTHPGSATTAELEAYLVELKGMA